MTDDATRAPSASPTFRRLARNALAAIVDMSGDDPQYETNIKAVQSACREAYERGRANPRPSDSLHGPDCERVRPGWRPGDGCHCPVRWAPPEAKPGGSDKQGSSAGVDASEAPLRFGMSETERAEFTAACAEDEPGFQTTGLGGWGWEGLTVRGPTNILAKFIRRLRDRADAVRQRRGSSIPPTDPEDEAIVYRLIAAQAGAVRPMRPSEANDAAKHNAEPHNPDPGEGCPRAGDMVCACCVRWRQRSKPALGWSERYDLLRGDYARLREERDALLAEINGPIEQLKAELSDAKSERDMWKQCARGMGKATSDDRTDARTEDYQRALQARTEALACADKLREDAERERDEATVDRLVAAKTSEGRPMDRPSKPTYDADGIRDAAELTLREADPDLAAAVRAYFRELDRWFDGGGRCAEENDAIKAMRSALMKGGPT